MMRSPQQPPVAPHDDMAQNQRCAVGPHTPAQLSEEASYLVPWAGLSTHHVCQCGVSEGDSSFIITSMMLNVTTSSTNTVF